MKPELKTYAITLCGQSYSIASDEDPVLLERAAQKVEAIMAAIGQSSPRISVEKKALLAALQIAHQVCKQEAEFSGAQHAVDDMLKTIGQLGM